MARRSRGRVRSTGVIATTFLPFAPGGYDSMAAPLAVMAWILGRIGLILVPIGLLWLWALSRDRTARPRWLGRLSIGASVLILVVISLIAFAASGSLLLATGAATVATLLVARLARHLRRHPARPNTRSCVRTVE